MPALAAPLSATAPGLGGVDRRARRPPQGGVRGLNARHGLTEHRAYLQRLPDGSFLVLAIHEGPGADTFLPNLMGSDDAFDQWFAASIGEIHGMDGSGPMPPLAARRL